MSEAIIPFLEAIRATCETAARAPDDALNQRRLEQAGQILSTLIADAKSGPRLEQRALEDLRRLLARSPPDEQGAADYAHARAAVARLITSGGDDEFAIRAVEIEQQYLVDASRAIEEDLGTRRAGAEAGSGEEMPRPDKLSAYLGTVFERRVEVLDVKAVSLGYSKATYLLDLRASGDIPAALVVRMDRPFNYLGTTVVDEYPILRELYAAGVPVPRPYALEGSGSVLGQPFIVVERKFGRNVGSHFSFPPRDPQLCERMARQLARIHRVPVERFAPSTLRGSSQSAQQQIDAEVERYRKDWTDLGAVSPTIEAAFRWIQAHARDAAGARTLVHGDFSLSNQLISESGEISAILDWEFAQLGVPAADVGWFYTAAQRLASFEEFLAAYAAAGGAELTRRQLEFFALWGMVKLAVMNFQVEQGFRAGRFHDIKHAYVSAMFSRESVLRVGAYLGKLLAA